MTVFSPVMSAETLVDFVDREFPQIHAGGRAMTVAGVEPGAVTVAFVATDRHLRPGGTVSGPSLFALCDYAAYCVILAHVGPVALAVTTSLTINFLRRPPPGQLVARAGLLKLGKRLAVVEVTVSPETDADPVAHAVATYSLPPS